MPMSALCRLLTVHSIWSSISAPVTTSPAQRKLCWRSHACCAPVASLCMRNRSVSTPRTPCARFAVLSRGPTRRRSAASGRPCSGLHVARPRDRCRWHVGVSSKLSTISKDIILWTLGSGPQISMNFEGDAFISYAHLDNVELIEGHKGWVATLHRALQTRVAQLHGEAARIWWDPKLQGNDYFADTLVERLQRVKALVAVVTPRYVKSEWGRRELVEFCKAADEQGGIRVQDRARIFKVLKTPVERELHPPELQSLLGYEFFKVDPDTGKVRELALDEIFGPEVQKDFCLKLDDLAHDICALLNILAAPSLPPPAGPPPVTGGVYVAVTTSELKDPREVIKRDLTQHGFTVFPDRPLPLDAPEMQAAVRDDLASCRMWIHMVGRTYSMVPEGGRDSLVELQNELAIERAARGQFSRLIWIPPGVHVDDERQRKVLDGLRMDPRIEQ